MKSAILLALGCVLVSIVGADDHQTCYQDESRCVQGLKQVLANQDLFWYGSAYSKNCPPPYTGSFCTNADKDSKSIIDRVYNTTSPQVNNNLKLAHVTFSSPEGHYYGCGHTYHVAPITYRLDPLVVTEVNTWTLDHLPTVEWEYDANSLYTVIVWDTGSYYMHGLYINARDGDLTSATPIDAYHGPIPARPIANAYLFAVFRQTQFVNPGTAGGILGSLYGKYQGAIPLSDLLSQMGAFVTEMVAANVLVIIGDPYSMERQKNNYIVNSCPYLFSKSPALSTIIRNAGMNASWTPPSSLLNYQNIPYLSSLNVELSVEYSMTRDITVESCCVKTTTTKTLYRPDPLGGGVVKAAVTSSEPRVLLSPIFIFASFFNGIKDDTYTLLMLDMYEVLNNSPNPTIMTHWMVNNIKSADIQTGDVTLPYLGPNPPDEKTPRPYVFFLMKQKDLIKDTSSWSNYINPDCPPTLKSRCLTRLPDMLRDWGIEEIVGVTWISAEQDAFARKRLYSELMFKSMFETCDGQPGFEDPCPTEQYCASTGNAPAVTLIAVMTVAMATFYTTYNNN